MTPIVCQRATIAWLQSLEKLDQALRPGGSGGQGSAGAVLDRDAERGPHEAHDPDVERIEHGAVRGKNQCLIESVRDAGQADPEGDGREQEAKARCQAGSNARHPNPSMRPEVELGHGLGQQGRARVAYLAGGHDDVTFPVRVFDLRQGPTEGRENGSGHLLPQRPKTAGERACVNRCRVEKELQAPRARDDTRNREEEGD